MQTKANLLVTVLWSAALHAKRATLDRDAVICRQAERKPVGISLHIISAAPKANPNINLRQVSLK